MARSKIPQTKPRLAVPTRHKEAAFVRMVHSTHARRLFYSKETAQWVEQGYTVWTMAGWKGVFGGSIASYGEDMKTAVDQEGRHWEFFGYIIPLYDEPQT